MSSACSVNSCISSVMVPSQFSGNKANIFMHDETSANLQQTTIPDIKKDTKYWERRRRNNEAARRSREKRRINDMDIDNKIAALAERNKQLEQELFHLNVDSGALCETSSKKSRLENLIPTIVSSNENVIFPIFTTLSSDNGITKGSESNLSCCAANIFPANLLSLSNIPFLSNLIATTNFNDDLATKPTLLLPPFQIAATSVDPTHASKNMANCSLTKFEKPRFESQKIEPFVATTDTHSILDLRLGPKNRKYFFNVSNGVTTEKEREDINRPYRWQRKKTTNAILRLRTRLAIREEVVRVVSKENRKLHNALASLSDDINDLKILVTSLTTIPLSNRCLSPDPINDP